MAVAVVDRESRAGATAQINARLNPALKQCGDEALSGAGLSPSQAIRALWELAARNADNPEAIQRALFPERAEAQKVDLSAAQRCRAEAIGKGARVVEDAYRAMGVVPAPSSAAGLSYDELRDLAYQERYGELMGWES